MERQPLSMDQKTQYCLNAYTIQRELQIQFNFCQNYNGLYIERERDFFFFFTEIEKNNPAAQREHKNPE